MNAANPIGAGGRGVTGYIYEASKKPENITRDFQSILRNDPTLIRTDEYGIPRNDNTETGKVIGDNLNLKIGKVLITSSYGINKVIGIAHAVAPHLGRNESYMKDIEYAEVAAAANSFTETIFQSSQNKICESLGLVLLGGGIYRGKVANILKSLKVAQLLLQDNPDVKNLDINLIVYPYLTEECKKIIASINCSNLNIP